MKNCSHHSQLETLAAALIDGFRAELYLTPKPGLVDLLNNGSHPDLSLLTMSRSIRLLRDYLSALCVALVANADLPELIAIGRRAEARMLEELGTNTHRGGIFLAGLLLCACRQADPADRQAFRLAVQEFARRFFQSSRPESSHGQQVRNQYRVGGIVEEACHGLPAVFEEAVPLLLQATEGPQVAYLAMARLMQKVDDTTSLYRCGEKGLQLLGSAGRRLERTILDGADPAPLLIELDRDFRTRNLTMGGVADLLGISFGYSSYLLQGRGLL